MSGEGIRDFDDRGDDARGAFALDSAGTSEPPRLVDPRDLGPMDTVDFEEARIDAAGEDVIGRERGRRASRSRAEMDSAFASFDEGAASYEYAPREWWARAGPGGEEAPERFDEEAPERFDASAGTRAELRAARARLRAFEREVDALRDENARLARALASVAKNENRAEADDGVDAGSNPGGADAAAGHHPGGPPAAAAREKERVDERS
jgi:hypothetical protein